jgi:ribonuclease HIII
VDRERDAEVSGAARATPASYSLGRLARVAAAVDRSPGHRRGPPDLPPSPGRSPPPSTLSQRTLVTTLTEEEGRELQDRLRSGSFEWRQAPHAVFSVRGGRTIATLYTSGKLVVQGDDPESFLGTFLGRHVEAPPPETSLELPPGPVVGSDEAGKGDFFGPLVVVALRLSPEIVGALEEGGLVESKQISDTRCRQLGAALLESFAPAVERLDPPEYNAEYARIGNLNAILADLHTRAVRKLAQTGDVVVIDQFGPPGRMQRTLRGSAIHLVQIPRAERVTAVAAASVVARHVFLEALAELSQQSGVDLPKGAGVQVDDAAREFLALHPPAELTRFAKLHFANARRLPGLEDAPRRQR